MYKWNQYKHIEKDNFIELKTLEFCFKWDIEKAKRVFEIRHKLNSDWFEKYIRYYLSHTWTIMLKSNWWHNPDWWIDLEWFIDNQKLYIQCKKYIENWKYKWEVSIHELRDFFWWVISRNWCNTIGNTCIMRFITTWFFSNYSKEFAKKNNIELYDYDDISFISKYYSLVDFEKDLRDEWFNIKDFKNLKYEQISFVDFTFDELTEEEKFRFWKNIRRHIIEEYNLDENNTWYETFNDNTLKEFWKIRSYEWLDKIYENENISRYRLEIIMGIEILQKHNLV